MSPEQAAWVRATVWTQGMRKIHRDTPRFYTACPCESGPSWHCRHGAHGSCRSTTPSRSAETSITTREGRVTVFPGPYVHPTPTATGPQRTADAQVWLADRVCRWVCSCPCHTETAQAAPVRQMADGWEQPGLPL